MRIPILPSLLVAAAVAAMIGLGVWQLRRAEEKEALLARYEAARGLPPVAFPTMPIGNEDLPLFRQSSGICLTVASMREQAGQNRA
ncbi:MAG: SURF1 family cytochrome oxidase biogenesis protein, partial [Brevundimonas sp.]